MSEATDNQTTDFLILRKIPYQDSGLILSGISPTQGQMSFFLRQSAARRRSYQFLDLFQLVSGNWRRSSGDLCYWSNVDLVEDFSGVARSTSAFEAACWLSQFTLSNTVQQMPIPRIFRALRVALTRLIAGRPTVDGVLTGFGLTFLEESGWLSFPESEKTQAAQCQLLLQMAAGGDFPALTNENWQALWNWTRNQLLNADCKAV